MRACYIVKWEGCVAIMMVMLTLIICRFCIIRDNICFGLVNVLESVFCWIGVVHVLSLMNVSCINIGLAKTANEYAYEENSSKRNCLIYCRCMSCLS